MNYVLFGFKNCGKGRVGEGLAKLLGRDFLDTDDLVEELYERQTGKRLSYRGIAEKHGMDFFRELEKQAVKSISSKGQMVIAVGGGTILFQENVAELKKNGKMILLCVEKETLFKRIMSKGIPAFFDKTHPRDSFERLFEERMEKFGMVADLRVECVDESPKEIAKQVMQVIGKG